MLDEKWTKIADVTVSHTKKEDSEPSQVFQLNHWQQFYFLTPSEKLKALYCNSLVDQLAQRVKVEQIIILDELYKTAY